MRVFHHCLAGISGDKACCLLRACLLGGGAEVAPYLAAGPLLVGAYAAEPIVGGALFTPGMTVPEPPARRARDPGHP